MSTRAAPQYLVTVASVGAPTELASPATAPLDHAAVRAVVAGIMLAMFLSALEQTIVAPALPAIGRSLGGIDELSWVVTAYLLAVTATTPLFGKLSDIYGRRVVLLWAIGIFIGGSIACALAPTIWVLVFARGLQGIGGGGLLPIAQTIIADLLSPQERPVIQGRTSIMFMSASILGPVLGGLFTDQLHWSLIFWINLPLGAVALFMSERALRQLPRNERPHQLDVIGAILMVAAGLSLMLALAWGGTHYRWSSPLIVALLAGSAMLWGLFATAFDRARAVHSADHIAGSRHQYDHLRGIFWRRHNLRHPDLYAALLRDGPRPLGEFVRTRADCVHGRHGGWFAGRGTADGPTFALHARAACRIAVRRHRSRRARRRSGQSINRATRVLAVCAGLRRRADVSDEHDCHAERGQAAPAWHRHRDSEFFPHLGRCNHRCGVRRYCAGQRRGRHRNHDAGTLGRGAWRFGASIPLGVYRGGDLPCDWVR